MRETRQARRADWGVVAPDNENFVIRVVCFGRQTFNTSLERLVTVRIRNDNGNCCRFRQFAPDAKRVSAPVDGNMRCFATTLQMILNGTPRGIELFRLLPDTNRTGAFASPPMIQDPRNVMNSTGQLGHAKKQIVILCAIELRTEPASFLHKFATHCRQMTNVIVREKKIG